MVLDKIKNALSHDGVVEELKSTITESNEKIKALTEAVRTQQEEQDKLLEQVKTLSKDHKKLSKLMEESHEQISIANEKLGRVVSELLLFKPKLEKEVATNFQKNMQETLEEATADIKIDAKAHQENQALLAKTVAEQENLLKEIEKLQDITKNIKAADFELSKHAKQLHLKDEEKLRLLKRVDELEKMLAKMKRR